MFFSVMFSIDVRALKFNVASFPFKLTMYFNKQVPKRSSILGSLKQCVIVYLLLLLNGDEFMLFRQATIERKKNYLSTLYSLIYERAMFIFIACSMRSGNMVKCHCVIAQFVILLKVVKLASKRVYLHLTSAIIFLFPFSTFHYRAIMTSKNTKPRAQTYITIIP